LVLETGDRQKRQRRVPLGSPGQRPGLATPQRIQPWKGGPDHTL